MITNWLISIWCQFRTWQIRTFGATPGTPLWCHLPLLSDRPDHLVPAEYAGYGSNPHSTRVYLFRESPIGTTIEPADVRTDRIEYRYE